MFRWIRWPTCSKEDGISLPFGRRRVSTYPLLRDVSVMDSFMMMRRLELSESSFVIGLMRGFWSRNALRWSLPFASA